MDFDELVAHYDSLYSWFENELDEYSGTPPATLPQYTSASGLQGMAASHRLWAGNILSMNDYREFNHGRDIVIAEAHDMARQAPSGAIQDLLRRIEAYIYRDDMPGGFFASCFSTQDDQLSQWRGYGSPPDNFAVGFSTAHFGPGTSGVGQSAPRRFRLLRVIYDHEDQRGFVHAFFKRLIDLMETLLRDGAAGKDAFITYAESTIQRATRRCFLTMKHRGFAEEREWRLIHQRWGDLPHGIDSELHNHMGREYVHLDPSSTTGTFAGRLPISSIRVGPRRSAADRAAALDLAQHVAATLDPEPLVAASEIPFLPS